MLPNAVYIVLLFLLCDLWKVKTVRCICGHRRDQALIHSYLISWMRLTWSWVDTIPHRALHFMNAPTPYSTYIVILAMLQLLATTYAVSSMAGDNQMCYFFRRSFAFYQHCVLNYTKRNTCWCICHKSHIYYNYIKQLNNYCVIIP